MKPSAAPGAGAGAPARTKKKSPKREHAPGAAEQAAPQPLKPRRKLFAGLMIVFALWVGVLLAMYFTTVFPARGVVEPPASNAN